MVLMEELIQQRKSLILILVKQRQYFYCNGDNSYLFVNRKEIYKFKFNNKNISTSQFNFLYKAYQKHLALLDLQNYLFKKYVYNFSVN